MNQPIGHSLHPILRDAIAPHIAPPCGYRPEDLAPASNEAIAMADAYTNNAGLPTYSQLQHALAKIADSGHPDAAAHIPELRGITEAEFGERLVEIARAAITR